VAEFQWHAFTLTKVKGIIIHLFSLFIGIWKEYGTIILLIYYGDFVT